MSGPAPMGSLPELLAWRAAATPGAEMLVDEAGRRVSFGQFRDLAGQVAGVLAAAGVRAGTPVTWQLPTTVEALALTAALARLGAVQNPVIPGYGMRNLEFACRQTGARLLITADRWTSHALGEQARAVAARVGGLRVVTEQDLFGPAAAIPALPPGDDPPPGAARWVFYTSGTTADPKGARHTDAAGLASGRGMALALGLTAGDRVGLVFPVAHIGGCGTWLAACLVSGCTMILDRAFDAERTTELQRREHVTIAGSGTVFTQLYLGLQRRQPGVPLFPDVRMLTAGAAPRPLALHEEVKREMGGIGVLSGYGMTEAPILTMAAVTDPDDKLAVTEGLPCPGVQLAIAPDGELLAKGPQVMLGYVDEALNAAAFDAGGYLRTGDLASIDADGYLTITGRIKDVIIRKGETISARAVELELMTHDAIAEAAVVGLPHPAQGELACAVVIPAAGQAAPGLEEVRAHLKGRGVAPTSWPERLEVAADFPRTSTGKVRKDQLRARLLERGA